MDYISNYKSKLLDKSEEDDNSSVNTENTSMRDGTAGPDIQDMFGNPEVERHAKPVKGERYLIFTIIMLIVLVIMVKIKEGDKITATYAAL